MSERNTDNVFRIVVTRATLARLRHAAAEMGMTDDDVWQLASTMVDEAALQAFRGAAFDPGREVKDE